MTIECYRCGELVDWPDDQELADDDMALCDNCYDVFAALFKMRDACLSQTHLH